MKRGHKTLEAVMMLLIIGVILLVSISSMNVSGKMALARNAKRSGDIEQLMMAVQQYLVDNESLPEGVGEVEKQIGTCTIGGEQGCLSTSYDCLDLSESLAGYMEQMPYDTEFGNMEKTGYSIVMNKYGIVTIRACGAENGELIEVSR